jgi:hypothetical protein
VLTPANAFPNLAFPQHLTGQTKTVQSFTYPGAVWPAPGTRASVVLDAFGAKHYTAAGTSATYTGITVGSGTNRALVIMVSWGTGGTAPASRSVVWDSGGSNQTMTEIGYINNVSVTTQVGLYGLVNPVAGNKTCAVSWTNSAESFVVGIGFTNVNQNGGSVSFPGFISNVATATLLNGQTLPVFGASSDYVVASFGSGSAIGSVTGTLIYYDNTSGTLINAGAEYATLVGQINNIGTGPLGPSTLAAVGVRGVTLTGPQILDYTRSFAGLPFPQHLTGQTNTVQNFLYPGAVQPIFIPPPTPILFAQILM